MPNLFGPCTITHDSVHVGKTFNGGSFNIVTSEVVAITVSDPICEPRALYGTGVIRLFEPEVGTITTDLELAAYAALVLTGDDFVITMPSAKLLWPTTVAFGINALKTFDIGFFFRPSGGTLIKFTT